MLQLSNAYVDRPVLSLRSGSQIGQTIGVIVNPDNLKIEGWFANSISDRKEYIIPVMEIRDVIHKGLVVNDHESLTDPEDMVRLKKVIDLRFDVLGKSVVSEKGHKIGKVADYAVDTDNYLIHQLFVNPPFLRSLGSNQLIIGRGQIVELNNKQIVISDASIKSASKIPEPAKA